MRETALPASPKGGGQEPDANPAPATYNKKRRPDGIRVAIDFWMALLRAVVPTEKYKLPDALKISDSCSLKEGEPLFSIGFSDPADRTNSNHLPIANQDSIFKRWSQGIFAGYVKSDNNNDENTNIWASTSVDILEGGSGGPLLNEDGQIVGIIKNSASNAENQFHYDGNENPGHLDWQSNAVPCAYLSQFIDQGHSG